MYLSANGSSHMAACLCNQLRARFLLRPSRTREGGYLFPLYLYVDHGDAAEDLEEMRRGRRRWPTASVGGEFGGGVCGGVGGRVKLAFVGDGTGT